MSARSGKLTEEDKKRRHEWCMSFTQSAFALATSMWWGGVVIAVVCLGILLPIQMTAGQTTVISYVLDWGMNLTIDRAVMLVLTGGSIAYGYRQYRVKKKETSEMGKKIAELQGQIAAHAAKGSKS
jgi:hypothetical protein